MNKYLTIELLKGFLKNSTEHRKFAKIIEEFSIHNAFDTTSKEVGKCVLIRFKSKKHMSGETIAHEALHAALFILDYIGSRADVSNSEPTAYLVQWVYRCCEKVRLGKVDKE